MKLKNIILTVIVLCILLWLTGFKINWKWTVGIIISISVIIFLAKNLIELYNRAIFYEHK